MSRGSKKEEETKEEEEEEFPRRGRLYRRKRSSWIGKPRRLPRSIRWSIRGRSGLIILTVSRNRRRGEAPSVLSILSPLLRTFGGMFYFPTLSLFPPPFWGGGGFGSFFPFVFHASVCPIPFCVSIFCSHLSLSLCFFFQMVLATFKKS